MFARNLKKKKALKSIKFGGFYLLFISKDMKTPPPLCFHSPPRRLVQSLPLSGCSHGNHQVSRQAWKARQRTCDSLHMLRQHTLITGGELSPPFKLTSTHCSRKKKNRQRLAGLGAADDQSASLTVYLPLSVSSSGVTHAHIQYTHK